MSRPLRISQSSNSSVAISLQDAGERSIRNVRPAKCKAVARKIAPINHHKRLAIEIASGWVGGAIGIAATHPLDSIRVVKQYQARILKNNLSYYEIFTQIKNTHGFGGFYRGVIPPTVLRGFGLAANRAGYNVSMNWFEGKKVNGTWRIWVVGGVAGMCTGVVDMPVHLLKCRAQVKVGLSKESFSLYGAMLRNIWKYEGVLAFTNGLIPQLLFAVSSYAMFYAIYDQMVICDFPVFVAGMVAGTVSWPLVVPFDCLRVRMQCQPYHVGFKTVLKEMLRQPIGKWFTGLGATTLRAAPRWGVTMVAIENCNNILRESF